MQRQKPAAHGANYVTPFSAKILNLNDGYGNAVVEITKLSANNFTANAARVSPANGRTHIDAALIAAEKRIKINDYLLGDDSLITAQIKLN